MGGKRSEDPNAQCGENTRISWDTAILKVIQAGIQNQKIRFGLGKRKVSEHMEKGSIPGDQISTHKHRLYRNMTNGGGVQNINITKHKHKT